MCIHIMCSCTYSELFVLFIQTFTLCLNHYAYVDWSILLLLVALCSMHFRRHGGGSRSASSMCVSACMSGRTVDGVRLCNLRRRLISVVSFTHTVYIASTKAILSVTSIMTNKQNVLENFGGVDANSLCQLLNNNDDNDNPDDEPNIVQRSSYYDDDSLNNLFKDKGNSFCILSLNCQSINAKFDQLNIEIQQLNSAQLAYRKHGCPVTLMPHFL